jgi:3-dehydroquinate dehydratase
MTGPVEPPRLVVTLPGRSVDALRRDLGELRGFADLAEVRLDRLPPAERNRIAELFPSPVPLVATLRSRAEGGEGPDDADERAAQLSRAVSLPFAAVDIEPARDAPPPPDPGPGSVRTIVRSFHANSPAHLVEAVRAAPDGPPPGDRTHLSKFVGPATLADLFETILPLVRGTRVASRVVHTTGPSGALLRLWAQRLGMPWVYCAPPDHGAELSRSSVEPSQLPVDALRRYFSAPEPGGLFAVLGRPIGHSRSPRIHTSWMRSEDRCGIYVALECGDASEFRRAISPLADGGFRGLNVTHPLKAAAFESSSVRDADAIRTACANTLRLRDGRVEAFNTDVAAVRRRFHELVASGRWDGE